MMRYLLIGAGLVMLVAAVYGQTHRFAFVGFDDPQLVTENVHVRQGVTAAGLKWAFFSAWRENVFYYPLSLLSHMIDVTWFGLDAGRHHLTSAALHAAAALSLFVLLAQLTGACWRPALAAGLFGVHPLAVDSVAWVAERSNVLCALLVFATLSAYARYAAGRQGRWYAFSLGLFVLALLAKPTAVMAPAAMLLLSPRKTPPGVGAAGRWPAVPGLLPFFLLAVVRLLAVLAAQRGPSPLVPVESLTPGALAANALTATAAYLVKAVYPFRLSVYYPFPESLPLWQPVAAGALLLLVTAAVFRYGRRRPVILAGWLWYLLFLAPSLGLVRSGPWPAMADHYVYIPSAGLFVMLAWLVPPAAKTLRAVTGPGLLLFFAVVSIWHAGHYRDSVTLFSRAVSLHRQNFMAYIGLGNAYRQQGRMRLAEENFRKALAIQPESPGAHNNLALLLAEKQQWREAERHFRMALALSPGFSPARHNLANLYLKQQAVNDTGRPRDNAGAAGPTTE